MSVLCADPLLGDGASPSSEEASPLRQVADQEPPAAAEGGEGQILEADLEEEPFSLGAVRGASETEEAIFPTPAHHQEYQEDWYRGGYDGYGGSCWGAGAMAPLPRANTVEQKLWLAKASECGVGNQARRAHRSPTERLPGAL